MEIKITKLLTFLSFFALQLHAENDLSDLKIFYETDQKQITNSKNIDSKNPLNDLVLDFSKVVDGSNNVIRILDSQFSNGSTSQTDFKNQLYLKSGEYIQITERGSIVLLSNGSFIIQFKEMPNLNDFALRNQLTFIRNLSDINTGIFKVENMYDLAIKLEIMKKDENIIALELDIVDPSVTYK